ncbi:MAG: AbrB/MazE/SpoVT family DNA-binding domain-containing protein [bacterium]
MVSTLTSKGQLTIPKKIREHLKLKTGDKLQFIINGNGKVELSPVKVSIKDLKGILRSPEKPVSLEDMEKAIVESGGHI